MSNTTYNHLIEISSKRYDAYMSFIRKPCAYMLVKEIKWYENKERNIIALIALDETDKDYSAAIHKRSNDSSFIFVDLKVSFDKIDAAYIWLEKKVSEIIVNSTPTVYKCKLFDDKYEEAKLSNFYKMLKNHKAYSSARNLIKEILPHFFDIDGNFIEQFQTTGFDARLWELYLFCYFNEECLTINRKYSVPDFFLSKGIIEVALEAATISLRKQDEKIDDIIQNLLETRINEETKDNMPLMFGSQLYSKSKHTIYNGKHYWELNHTKDKPFVIAIADFHESMSTTWSTTSLVNYLWRISNILL